MTEKKIILIESLCKGCGYCIEFCPKKAFEKSEKVNEKGVQLPEIKNPQNCTKCRLCIMLCPDFALVMNEEKLDDE